MNYLKIQKKILEAIYKNPLPKLYMQEQGNSIIITVNCLVVYIIPKFHFYIDLNNFISTKKYDGILCLEKQAIKAKRTNQLREIGPFIFVKIANETTEVWVNREFLKDFGKNVEFKIIDKKNPVFVYENNVLVGCILPAIISAQEEENE